MTGFEPGTIVWVPFPFVEREQMRERPALVISRPWRGDDFDLQWAMMITSKANAGWPDDISLIDRFEECGLPAPSVIRPAKVAAFVVASARANGTVPTDIRQDVIAVIERRLPRS